MSSPTIAREVFIPAPPGIGIGATTFYTRADAPTLKCVHSRATKGDTVDVGFERDSFDNGRTWTEAREIVTCIEQKEGVWRRHFHPGYLDPNTGKLLMMHCEALLRNDDLLQDGTRGWRLFYAVSSDGGQTYDWEGPIIEEGEEFDEQHPIACQWVGKNALMLGAISETPITLGDGTILVPCQITPIGEDGDYHNPGGGYTYYEPLVLQGTWQADGRLAWRSSATVKPDPARTTRGLIEPTIAELSDGRVLMVMRGSNATIPELPGVKWFSTSSDGGLTWTEAVPWMYTDGEVFFSPSSCSQLIPHSNGKLFWMGNISPENPNANAPRYPLVLGEVDQTSGLLTRNSVVVIDTRQEGESERLQLSNFYAREDRETGEIVLHLSRMFAQQKSGATLDWTTDALIYRIAV